MLTLRARRYVVAVADGSHWRRVATVTGGGSRRLDTIVFPATRTRAVRIRLLSGTGAHSTKTTSAPAVALEPMLDEVTAR